MELEVKIEKELRNFTLRADFSLRDEVFALLGASGCGKSMTLKCIAGLERPDRGRIVLDGEVLFDNERGIDLPPQKRRVGYLFQNFALFPNMTIADNIRFVARGTRQQREERVRENLARFALSELGNAYPMELSGGQQQRAALARILASDAKILLLDEPFSALDHYLKWKLELELREVLRSYDGAALLVSHDRGEVYRMSRRVCVLNEGASEPATDTTELFARPRTLQSALITGCKNCAPVSLTQTGHLLVPSWNAVLACEDAEQSGITHAGIRAHFVVPCAEDAENALLCQIVHAEDDVFSRVLTLLPRGGTATIRAEMGKADASALAVGCEAWFRLPREHVMLLMETHAG